MKIRNGFVSNSSSSSFVIMGVKTKLKDIDPKSFKKKDTQYFVVPTDEFAVGEGPQYFYIEDVNALNLFLENSQYVRSVYEVLAECNDGEKDITNVKFPAGKKVVLLSGTMDQYCPGDVDGIKEIFGYADIKLAGDVEEEEEEEENVVTDKDVLRLECTTGGSNKFYEMKKNNGRGTFTARYGKIGSAGKEEVYNLSDWDSKLLEKTKKGYVIV